MNAANTQLCEQECCRFPRFVRFDGHTWLCVHHFIARMKEEGRDLSRVVLRLGES